MADLLPIESYLGELDKIKEQWAEFLQGYGIAVSADNKISGNWVDAFKNIEKGLIEGGMTKLKSDVAKVKDYAFYNSSLRTVELKNATIIGTHSFQNCSNLKTVIIDNVKTIGDYAFSGCSSLTFPNISSCETIGEWAFSNCKAILNSEKMKNVRSIKTKAFSSVTWEGTDFTLNCQTIENDAFPNMALSYVETVNLPYLENTNPYITGSRITRYYAPMLKTAQKNFANIGSSNNACEFVLDSLEECNGFSFCYIKNGILNLPNLKKGGRYTFRFVYGLTNLNIPLFEEINYYECFYTTLKNIEKLKFDSLKSIYSTANASNFTLGFITDSYNNSSTDILKEAYFPALVEYVNYNKNSYSQKLAIFMNQKNLEFVSFEALETIRGVIDFCDSYTTGGERAECYYYMPKATTFYSGGIGIGFSQNSGKHVPIDRIFMCENGTLTLTGGQYDSKWFTGVKNVKIGGSLVLYNHSNSYYVQVSDGTLEYLDIGNLDSGIYTYSFYYSYRLTALVIRNSTVPILNHPAAFSECYRLKGTVNTTYNPDGIKGAIYVGNNDMTNDEQDALVGAYKSANYWSDVKNTIDIKPIRELPSEYANIDWTPRTYTE